MVSACSTRYQTGDTDSFQLVIPLTVQLDSQGTFVPCEARIVWYSAGRTSSRQLRETTPGQLMLDMLMKVLFDRSICPFVIGLQRQEVVATLVADLASDSCLAAHRIDRHNTAFDG